MPPNADTQIHGPRQRHFSIISQSIYKLVACGVSLIADGGVRRNP